MIKERFQLIRIFFEQDMFQYVDIEMKRKRKEARNEKRKLGRDETRFSIWSAFDKKFTIVYGIEYTHTTSFNKFP